MQRLKLWTKVFVCGFVLSAIAVAQVTTGTISGTVSDATGAVVPGVTVSLKSVEKGISRTVRTDEGGRYRAPELGLGSYDISAEAAGFQTVIRTGITLTVAREAVVDFTLQVGTVAENVTVTGEAPLVQTANATVAALVDERAMRELPLNGRSFADLTGIQPGVLSDLEIAAAPTQAVYTGGGGAARRSIGGTKPQQSTYLLDGMEISTPSEGMPASSVLGQQLGVEAIREFVLLQNNYGAQYGRASGGVVSAVTQSGNNSFHGSVFEFLRNEKLDARDYFLDPRLPKAPLKRNQFGASVGGPIRKNRTFFFLNYEGVRQSAGTSFLGSVLTAETRQGRITGCPAGRDTCSREEAIVTRTLPVDPNIIPIMNLLPLPNGPYRSAGVADYNAVPRWHADENFGIVRLDQQLSQADSVFGRFTKDQSSRIDQYLALTPKPFTGFQVGGYLLLTISETHVFSPAVLNTYRVGFSRRNDHLFYNYTQGGDQFPNAPGLDPRLSPVKGVPMGLYSVPGINFYGGSGGGSTIGPNLSGPAVFVDNTFDYDDSVMINKGRHSIALGGNFKRYQMNHLNEPWVYGGTFTWDTIENFLTNNPRNTTQLLGFTTPGTQKADVYRGWRQSYGAVYFQDDFKARSSLTVNMGLRWEGIRSPREVNGKLAVLKDIYRDKDFVLLTQKDPFFGIKDGLNGLSPRVGLAWTPFPDQKTVVRAGFGVFKEMPLAYIYQLALEAPPYSKRFTVNRPDLKFPFPFQDPNLVGSAGEPLMMPLEAKIPYTLQWTFSLERQLGQSLVVKANYVGTRGVNLFAIYNPNQRPSVIRDGRQFTPPDAQVPNPNYTSYRYVAPISDQIYNALQMVVERRSRAGLSLNGSYTWARNIDNGGGAGIKGAEQISGAASFAVYNGHDLSSERGLSSLHVQHNFILAYSYGLPFGPGHRWGAQSSSLLSHLVGGWSVNGTNTIRSGLPVNIQMTPRQSGCVAQSCNERPDLRPGGNNNPVIRHWTPERYFDPSNFVVQPLGFFGNVGRNTLIRPGQFLMNLSFTKDNRLAEGKNLEFRAELFNFLNHPNFGAPNNTVFRDAAGNLDPNVGRITTTSTKMRQIQLGLKLTF
jgi:Carboxypeptidase regulatory-like domain/TonB-dependent Receptor Plug Domain/TonB dependent receptor